MKRIDRRGFLKVATAAGAGTALAMFPLIRNIRASDTQFFLVTDDPDRDKVALLGTVTAGKNTLLANTVSISPTPQDLVIIRDGMVIDPVGEGCRQPALQNFAHQLRQRSNEGHTLVTVTSKESRDRNQVTFEINGRIIDQVGINEKYNSIVVPGHQGETEFTIEDGLVSVVRSSCKNQVCKRMGHISTGRIICAPNKLVATVRHSNHTFDSVTG